MNTDPLRNGEIYKFRSPNSKKSSVDNTVTKPSPNTTTKPKEKPADILKKVPWLNEKFDEIYAAALQCSPKLSTTSKDISSPALASAPAPSAFLIQLSTSKSSNNAPSRPNEISTPPSKLSNMFSTLKSKPPTNQTSKESHTPEISFNYTSVIDKGYPSPPQPPTQPVVVIVPSNASMLPLQQHAPSLHPQPIPTVTTVPPAVQILTNESSQSNQHPQQQLQQQQLQQQLQHQQLQHQQLQSQLQQPQLPLQQQSQRISEPHDSTKVNNSTVTSQNEGQSLSKQTTTSTQNIDVDNICTNKPPSQNPPLPATVSVPVHVPAVVEKAKDREKEKEVYSAPLDLLVKKREEAAEVGVDFTLTQTDLSLMESSSGNTSWKSIKQPHHTNSNTNATVNPLPSRRRRGAMMGEGGGGGGGSTTSVLATLAKTTQSRSQSQPVSQQPQHHQQPPPPPPIHNVASAIRKISCASVSTTPTSLVPGPGLVSVSVSASSSKVMSPSLLTPSISTSTSIKITKDQKAKKTMKKTSTTTSLNDNDDITVVHPSDSSSHKHGSGTSSISATISTPSEDKDDNDDDDEDDDESYHESSSQDEGNRYKPKKKKTIKTTTSTTTAVVKKEIKSKSKPKPAVMPTTKTVKSTSTSNSSKAKAGLVTSSTDLVPATVTVTVGSGIVPMVTTRHDSIQTTTTASATTGTGKSSISTSELQSKSQSLLKGINKTSITTTTAKPILPSKIDKKIPHSSTIIPHHIKVSNINRTTTTNTSADRGDVWSEQELADLYEAHSHAPISAPDFWEQVAASMSSGRTSEQCQDKWFQSLEENDIKKAEKNRKRLLVRKKARLTKVYAHFGGVKPTSTSNSSSSSTSTSTSQDISNKKQKRKIEENNSNVNKKSKVKKNTTTEKGDGDGDDNNDDNDNDSSTSSSDREAEFEDDHIKSPRKKITSTAGPTTSKPATTSTAATTATRITRADLQLLAESSVRSRNVSFSDDIFAATSRTATLSFKPLLLTTPSVLDEQEGTLADVLKLKSPGDVRMSGKQNKKQRTDMDNNSSNGNDIGNDNDDRMNIDTNKAWQANYAHSLNIKRQQNKLKSSSEMIKSSPQSPPPGNNCMTFKSIPQRQREQNVRTHTYNNSSPNRVVSSSSSAGIGVGVGVGVGVEARLSRGGNVHVSVVNSNLLDQISDNDEDLNEEDDDEEDDDSDSDF